MDIHTPLFEGKRIVFGPVDYDHDPEVESRWTHDPEYLRLLGQDPARPLSPALVKKKYEAIEKEAEESKNLFYFTIRARAAPDTLMTASASGSVSEAGPTPETEANARADGHSEPETSSPERLLGFARLYWIDWANGCGWIQLGIGDPQDRGKGYGSEALRLLLHYAFAELNLYRLMAGIPEYNEAACRLFAQAGFVEEVRRREAVHRYGRRWDYLQLGILREEWHA